jgi:MazG family protein
MPDPSVSQEPSIPLGAQPDSADGTAPAGAADERPIASSADRREAIAAELVALYDLTRRLRRECPWDRVQTQQDIVAYTLEETYELVDAVRGAPPHTEGASAGHAPAPERHDAPSEQRPAPTERHAAVRGELGDLLFQVYFLAQVAEEEGWYDLAEVAQGIRHKLIRRHPHIFGDGRADTPDEVRRTWETIKRDTEGREGIFHEVPGALPATLFAHKLQQRAATVGFDWREAYEVLAKIKEEIDELEVALSADPAGRVGTKGERPRVSPEVAHEVGDLLFAVVNLARKLGADPELELRMAAGRFRHRVETAAELAEAEGETFSGLGIDEQEGYYQRAKAELHQRDGRPAAGSADGSVQGGGR